MRILITGASRGIGRAVAKRLAADGAQVAVCASSHPAWLDELVAEIRDAGGVALPLVGDLQSEETPARLVAQAAAALGGLDAVIGNAAIVGAGPLLALETADWDRLFAVNVRAQWLLARAAHPWLKLSRGSMVLVASMSGMQPYAGLGAYSPTKAALIMLARQLAQEWAADGIRVNCVSPGMVRTRSVYDEPQVKRAREALIPLHRVADAQADIAGILSFLVGPDSAYVTGHNLVADGGFLDSLQNHIVWPQRGGGQGGA